MMSPIFQFFQSVICYFTLENSKKTGKLYLKYSSSRKNKHMNLGDELLNDDDKILKFRPFGQK